MPLQVQVVLMKGGHIFQDDCTSCLNFLCYTFNGEVSKHLQLEIKIINEKSIFNIIKSVDIA